jgi:hypothetical protein
VTSSPRSRLTTAARKGGAAVNVKKTREGTLVRFHDQGSRNESLEDRIARLRSTGAIFGMNDFLEKADQLAAEMSQRGEVSKAHAASLANAVALLRDSLADGADKGALYNAVGAGLTFATLCNEQLDDDRKPEKGGKRLITRRRYFAAVNQLKAARKKVTLENVAEILECSAEAVRKWKKDRIE